MKVNRTDFRSCLYAIQSLHLHFEPLALLPLAGPRRAIEELSSAPPTPQGAADSPERSSLAGSTQTLAPLAPARFQLSA